MKQYRVICHKLEVLTASTSLEKAKNIVNTLTRTNEYHDPIIQTRQVSDWEVYNEPTSN